jgi:hypothetical protein
VERRRGVRRDDRPGWARVRSGVLLVLLLTGIGVGLAAVVGALAVASAALIDRALG